MNLSDAQYKLPPEGGTTNGVAISFLDFLQSSGSGRPADARRPWAEALLLSMGLSLLFVFVYGLSNAMAAGRSNVGTCFFGWELRIPFVPALIVPYMSIDLFFVASFLLCKDSNELRSHSRRIATAILIAGSAFVLFPLMTGYPRPEVSAWTGRLFELLWSFDKPHNLAPSLHIAFASLLWPVYARHTRGRVRWFVNGWFALMIASPIFTWQHHLLDIATGAMLGQACVFAFPEHRDGSLVRSAARNFRVARFYAAGSATLAVLAIGLGWSRGVWYWLLWPAVSLALIAIAYLRGNSNIFRKRSGRIPISTRVVLGPYLCGAEVSRLIHRRRRAPWIEAAPGLHCGRLLIQREALAMRAMGITGVLDLTAEYSETHAFHEIEYLNVPVLDLTQPSREQLDLAIAFITKHASLGGVYVHCALGVSRSVAVVEAYIASHKTEPPMSGGRKVNTLSACVEMCSLPIAPR